MATQDITFYTSDPGPGAEAMLEQMRSLNEQNPCGCDEVEYITDHSDGQCVAITERHEYDCRMSRGYRARMEEMA